MKPRSHVILGLSILIILSLACNLLTATSKPSEPDVQAPPPASFTEVVAVTEAPPQPSSNLNTLAGLVTSTENTLIVYDTSGAELSRIAFPQLSNSRGHIHVAGTLGEDVPIMYFSFSDGDETLFFKAGPGEAFPVLQGTSFLGLTGAAKQPVVAFSQIEYSEASLRSKLYVGNIQTLSLTDPVSVIDDPEFWAIKPILVDEDGGTPTQVWYTRIAYGIGGDIVFEPRKGLFALDYLTRQANTILGNDVSPWEISEDRNWVAYSAAETQANSMCVKNLGSGAELCFPALPASEPRGVGNAFFSPDAQYIAWMEGDGWQMAEVPNFKSTVRVGQNNGVIIADLPANTFESTAGIGPIYRAEPAAWLDSQTLIVQVRGQEWDQVTQLSYNVVSRETTYLASGEFVGLLYP